MMIVVCLLALICSAVASPAHETSGKIDLTQLVSKKAYVEPINPVQTVALPGSRIVGGAELSPHSAPYQAALIVDNNILCSGTLISTTRVLTTAYCLFGGSYVEVILGAHYFSEEEATQARVTSTSVRIHESYDVDGQRANDVALIFMPTVVKLNDYVKVVPLAQADTETYEGSWGLLSGWGTTTDSSSLVSPALRGVYVSVISNAECRSIYGDAVVLDSKMCTSGAGIVGACTSDSGDPLVVDGVQVGIAAFNGKCEIGLPTGYTRISEFRTWIQRYA